MYADTEFSVIGGDLRLCCLAELLAERGKSVCTAGLEKAEPAAVNPVAIEDAVKSGKYIVMPMPLCRGENLNAPLSPFTIKASDILSFTKSGQVVFAGKIPRSLYSAVPSGVILRDYMECEELAVMNAVPTAEGAVFEAMRASNITIYKSKCLVTGYGRIGKILAEMLRRLNAEVTVSARNGDSLAAARAFGFDTVKLSRVAERMGSFDFVFNTVPAPVIGQAELSRAKSGCVMIDLASAPGGIDLGSAKALAINAFAALSLPGKAAPKTAGKIILDTIQNLIEEDSL